MGLVNLIMRRLWTGQFSVRDCSHLDLVQDVTAGSDGCDQCVGPMVPPRALARTHAFCLRCVRESLTAVSRLALFRPVSRRRDASSMT